MLRIPLLVGWLSALLHFWPRDRWLGLSTWFYATPWGVILLLAAITTLACWISGAMKRSSLVRAASLALLLLASGMWLAVDWNWRGPAAAEASSAADATDEASSQPIRLLIWNIYRGRRGTQQVAREVLLHDPDVVCLIEAGKTNNRMRARWQSLFPEYTVSMLGGGIVCLVRGSSGECNAINLTEDSLLRILPVEVKGREFQCALVDIESSIFKSREPPLARLASELNKVAGPIVLAGDFNTPLDSVHFQPLSEHFSCAAQVVGSGYSATWPVPLPVLTLDQVWGNAGVRFISHKLAWAWSSDHRPVVVEFEIEE